jgi:hypothetical protein
MPTAANRQRGRLSKRDLVSRLDRRSRERYGGQFKEEWLNDLIKDGLVPGLERSENQGRRPNYFGTRFHYRRALQVRRLAHLGITRRDAQLIQLFVRGYGVEAWQIREELRRELARAIAKLRPKLRSAYFQNARDVTPKIANVVGKQLGPLDERLAAAGLEQPMSFYLEQTRLTFGTTNPSHSFLFGWLLIEKEASTFPEYLEAAFRCDDEVLSHAKLAFRSLNQHGFRKMLGNAVLDSAEFTTVALVWMLLAKQLESTPESLLDRMPQRAGFEKFLGGLVDEVTSAEPEHSGQ